MTFKTLIRIYEHISKLITYSRSDTNIELTISSTAIRNAIIVILEEEKQGLDQKSKMKLFGRFDFLYFPEISTNNI
ncbi:CLUMA_CG021097, isoform A [Clunio marinus]|uniref:CLUMA_CG021097, isoform A n=1 Tax=Clunio marinus TaxID=568069 RepID=A0A1J1J6U6_9DIPT|nr:CLUMA_CG021097, isoform A [Clunio marinus]